MSRRAAAFLGALGIAMAVMAPRPVAAQEPIKIWDGVYTGAQAERGKVAYTTSCVRCHMPDLGGDQGPPLKGEPFMANWENQGLDRLFAKMRDTMPPNFGSLLDPNAKIDILAYVLQVNTFPAGQTELKLAGDLDLIQIVRKGTDVGIPNFALVQTVGCLTQESSSHWTLTKTASPVQTREQTPNDQALAEARGKPLGGETFVLVNVAPSFGAPSHAGHKVEARGLLYRSGDDRRLNLTSLSMLDARCN